MSITDQEEIQSTQDQWTEGKSDEVVTQSQTIEVNWQMLTAEKLLENYTKLQGEYTRATQETSKTKKESELSSDDKAAIDFLKKNWFATQDDLDSVTLTQKRDSQLKGILSANPDLAPFENAIKQLSSDNNVAIEDVIEKYGFKTKNKLAKARNQWDVKGTPEKKEKSISEMSTEEYQTWKQVQWVGNGGSFI